MQKVHSGKFYFIAVSSLAVFLLLVVGVAMQFTGAFPDVRRSYGMTNETVAPEPEPLQSRPMDRAEISRQPLLDATASPPAPSAAHSQQAGSGVRLAKHLPAHPTAVDTERFPEADLNPLNSVRDTPVSTFSVDVDTASYAYVRSELTGGRLPRPEAVRTEELVNYFTYDYPMPDQAEHPFSTSISVVETPWNPDTKLVQIGLQGYKVPLADLPPQNLVFLIDTSGSMSDSNKLPLLKKSFLLLLSTLRDSDSVAIVTYAGDAGVALEPTSVADRNKIARAVTALGAGGSTAGHAGLEGAYALAGEMQEKGGDTRVILATDGDFNVGLSGTDALTRYIKDQRESGIYLSVLGFGRGNYNDDLMQALAQNGNGLAAYIDTYAEARKVLVDQVVSTIATIARDVKIQVEFNPATVAEYRLIGYETRALKREDFNNDTVDAGDIGPGHTVTALYEITPVGSPAVKLDDMRYGRPVVAPLANETDPDFSNELAFVKLRYKLPDADRSTLITTPVTFSSADIAESDTLFAAAVAAFGQKLQGSEYLGRFNVKDMEALARDNLGNDPNDHRSEFSSLIRLASFAEH